MDLWIYFLLWGGGRVGGLEKGCVVVGVEDCNTVEVDGRGKERKKLDGPRQRHPDSDVYHMQTNNHRCPNLLHLSHTSLCRETGDMEMVMELPR